MKHKTPDIPEATAVVMPGKRLKGLGAKPLHAALLILIALLVVTLLALGGYSLYLSSKAKPAVCSDAVLEQASAVLDRSKVDELRPIAESVEKLDDFERDANCLYVTLSYYIYIQDPSKARLYLEKLKKIYDPAKGFSSKLGERIRTIEELQLEVEFVEKAGQERRSNIQTVPNVE